MAVNEELPASQTSLWITGLACETTKLFYVRTIIDGDTYDTSTRLPSAVAMFPCNTDQVAPEPELGMCPEDFPECLDTKEWPEFSAIFREIFHDSQGSGATKLYIKHIEWKGDFNWRITTLADYIWGDESHPPYSLFGQESGSYEQKKGLFDITYTSNTIYTSADFHVYRDDELYYLTNYPFTDGGLLRNMVLEAESVPGIPEDRANVCYRNICDAKDAALRFGNYVVTNNEHCIPLELGDRFSVLEIRIDEERRDDDSWDGKCRTLNDYR